MTEGRSTLRTLLLAVIALAVCALVYAYGVHMDRMIAFDEIGLHNPVYTYLTTGRMTYPMHGQPGYMVVHPPTHYLLTALLMKLGLPLFVASAVPVIALTVVLSVVLVMGRFSAATAAALLIGYFVALTTWSDFFTLRPDLHVTAAWFTALVTLETARARGWNPTLLFVGSATAVLGAAVHYWGVTSLLLPVFYAGVLLWERGPRGSAAGLAAILAGGCLIGLPFLLLFVVPYYQPIIGMVRAVQGDGTAADALGRHLRSYDALQALSWDTMHLRPLSSALAMPALSLRIPAVLIAVPVLAAFRETRVLALGGAVLPLFVLFFSQGKQVGYTGYLTPEFVLLFAALLLVVFEAARRIRPSPRVLAGVIGVVACIAVAGTPRSMRTGWAWTRSLDALDVIRAAAQRVVGPQALVAVTSAAVWYTGGGTFVWDAFNEITDANRGGDDIRAFLAPVDAVVLDTNWWKARSDLAPLGTWYVEDKLQLSGFVFPNDPLTAHLMHLFLSPKGDPRVRGSYIQGGRTRTFQEDGTGDHAVTVLACRHMPAGAFEGAYYKFAFAYDRQPAPESPSLLLLGSPTSAVPALIRQAGDGCRLKESVRGFVTVQDTASLRASQHEQRIQFFHDRRLALEASGRSARPAYEDVAMSIGWDRVALSGSGPRSSVHSLPLEVTPPPTPWAYGALLPIVTTGKVAGRVLRLDVLVSAGPAGFGILTPSEDSFIARQSLQPSAEPQVVELTVPSSVDRIGPVVIQNWDVSGQARVVVRSIRLLRPAAVTSRCGRRTC